MPMHDDEVLDLVNQDDQVIGTIYKKEFDHFEVGATKFIRNVEVLFQNDEGKLWIPKRTADKIIAPGGLDYSAGGHVSSGETYIEAILKEIEEELNLKLQESDLIHIRTFEPGDLPYFRALYVHYTNQTPNFNPNDYVSGNWLTPAELILKLESGILSKSGLLRTVKSYTTTKI